MSGLSEALSMRSRHATACMMSAHDTHVCFIRLMDAGESALILTHAPRAKPTAFSYDRMSVEWLLVE